MENKNYNIKYPDGCDQFIFKYVDEKSNVLDIGRWTGGCGESLIKNNNRNNPKFFYRKRINKNRLFYENIILSYKFNNCILFLFFR